MDKPTKTKPNVPYAFAFWGTDGEAAAFDDADDLSAFVNGTEGGGDVYVIHVDDDPTLYTIDTEPRLMEVL